MLHQENDVIDEVPKKNSDTLHACFFVMAIHTQLMRTCIICKSDRKSDQKVCAMNELFIHHSKFQRADDKVIISNYSLTAPAVAFFICALRFPALANRIFLRRGLYICVFFW